ncbi:MAG: hypothetical protein AB3K77_15260 [Methanosarcinaceae archaeon]
MKKESSQEHHVLREQTFGSGPVPRLVELSGDIFGPLLLKLSTLKFSALTICSNYLRQNSGSDIDG